MPRAVADAAAGRHFEVARVHALLVVGNREARIRHERPVDVRTTIHPLQHQSKRAEPDQHLDRSGRRKCGQARVRDLLGQPDVDVLSKRCRDLVLKELSEAAMPRIDPAQQLAFVEAEA